MSRETAFSALFAAVSAAYPWGLASRRMKLWSEVPSASRPAFFQLESGPETYQWASPATPRRTFEAKLFLYFDARDPSVFAEAQRDPTRRVVDARTALSAQPAAHQRPQRGGGYPRRLRDLATAAEIAASTMRRRRAAGETFARPEEPCPCP